MEGVVGAPLTRCQKRNRRSEESCNEATALLSGREAWMALNHLFLSLLCRTFHCASLVYGIAHDLLIAIHIGEGRRRGGGEGGPPHQLSRGIPQPPALLSAVERGSAREPSRA